MTILPLIIITFASLLMGWFSSGRWRIWILLVASILAIYWLQPASPIRHLDFWLPTACLILTSLTWSLTRPQDAPGFRNNLVPFLVILGVILVVGLTRYLGPVCCLTSTRPPAFLQICLVLAAVTLLGYLAARFAAGRKLWLYGGIGLIIVLFVMLKSEPLAQSVSVILRSTGSQSVDLASAFDIRWLGFSYVAFRLIHSLVDRLTGKLPDLALGEFVTYVIFYPAFSAGPIDRVQRFTQDLHQPFQLTLDTTLLAGRRIILGVFSKFVLADGLELIALNAQNATQVNSTGWLWVLLYAYAFRIYFDFSGYTQIAIGIGQLLGIRLPENFDQPYLKQNLTLFWNSWHMTLAQWFRAYFFNPLTRLMRSSPRNIPMPLIIFAGQLSTFILIGLWHGISWNFAIWGAWHGMGLFIHNRWSAFLRSRTPAFDTHPLLKNLLGVGGILMTFHFVSLGWVWFALSSPALSWNTLLRLVGLM